MLRIATGGIGGFFLIFIEAYIVMAIKGYRTIEFGGIGPFFNVWAMNFFFVFCILTHIKLWYDEKHEGQQGGLD